MGRTSAFASILNRGQITMTRLRSLASGLTLIVVIALAAHFLSEHYGGSVMLYALLLGLPFNYLSDSEKAGPGVAFAATDLMRLGVGLMGVRITFEEIAAIGFETALLVASAVLITIVLGFMLARAAGLSKPHAMLSAGAVSICGASAALAIASVLPKEKHSERNTLLTVAGVTALSTLAMIAYPILAAALNFDAFEAGVFIGATIHDVAQVVGAGYSISEETGETATIVKLMRVTCLFPVVIALSIVFRNRQIKGTSTPIVPAFLGLFIILAAMGSFGWIPDNLRLVLSEASQWLLTTGIAALGVRTSLKALKEVSPRPAIALCIQTILLAAVIMGYLGLNDFR